MPEHSCLTEKAALGDLQTLVGRASAMLLPRSWPWETVAGAYQAWEVIRPSSTVGPRVKRAGQTQRHGGGGGHRDSILPQHRPIPLLPQQHPPPTIQLGLSYMQNNRLSYHLGWSGSNMSPSGSSISLPRAVIKQNPCCCPSIACMLTSVGLFRTLHSLTKPPLFS